jgi:F0F1-type ATP synthase assembly protein I
MKNWSVEESLMNVFGILVGATLLVIGVLIDAYINPYLNIPYLLLICVLIHYGMKRYNIG